MEQMKDLYAKGVDKVIQPELEAGLEITRQALLHLRLPASEVMRYTDALRKDQCSLLTSDDDELKRIALLVDSGSLELDWLVLDHRNSLNGRTIGEAALRTHTGASVVGVNRKGVFLPNPGPEFRFEQGDSVAVIGKYDQVESFRELVAVDPETPRM
jgi:CPA2 family monovalent cation:H+ antiporter-2